MKPVFQESIIQKLKGLIEGDSMSHKKSVEDLVDDIEKSLKEYNDNSENRILLYGSSILIVLLALLLFWKIRASWVIMFFIIWLGGFMYYRVNERSLVLENLKKKAKITPYDSIPKIEYLQSGIELKSSRKNLLSILLSIFLPGAAMMTYKLFYSDSSFWMNIGILVLAAIASFFFWKSFYKEDLKELDNINIDLQQLKTNLVMKKAKSSENYENEEE